MFDASINANKSTPPTPSQALELMRQEIAAHKEQNDQKSYVGTAVSTIAGFVRTDSLGAVEKLNQDLQNAMKRGDNAAADKLAAQATGVVEADKKWLQTDQQVTMYGSGMVKTAGLFLPGRAGWAIAAATGAFDQAKPTDSLEMQLTDGGLGLAKGLALKGTFNKIGGSDLGIASKALSLGISSRVIEGGLTRQTYQTADGSYSAAAGIARIGDQAFNRTALTSDLITFGLAHGAVGGINSITGGALRNSPFMSTIATGGIFGVSSGSVQEINRQRQAGENFDLSKVLTSAALTGVTDMVASAPGAKVMSMRMNNVERINQTQEVSSTSPERPSISSMVQRNFDGINTKQFQLVDADKGIVDRLRANPNEPVMARVRGILESGKLGPAVNMLIQHAPEGSGVRTALDPKLVGAADLIATCNPKSLMPDAFAKHIIPQAESLYLTQTASGRLNFRSNLPEQLGVGESQPVKLGNTVSELLSGKGTPDYLDNTHDRLAIAKAMRHFKTPVRFVNGGADSIVFELPDRSILKITDHGWDPSWGTREIATSHGPRLIDAPVIQKPKTIDLEDASITYFVQKRLRTPVTEQGVRVFNAEIEQDGKFKFWDNDFKEHGRGQLGIDLKDNQIYLLDYDAVRTPDRVPKDQVDGSTWWGSRYLRSRSSSDPRDRY